VFVPSRKNYGPRSTTLLAIKRKSKNGVVPLLCRYRRDYKNRIVISTHRVASGSGLHSNQDERNICNGFLCRHSSVRSTTLFEFWHTALSLLSPASQPPPRFRMKLGWINDLRSNHAGRTSLNRRRGPRPLWPTMDTFKVVGTAQTLCTGVRGCTSGCILPARIPLTIVRQFNFIFLA
jgi:hypothetical protein